MSLSLAMSAGLAAATLELSGTSPEALLDGSALPPSTHQSVTIVDDALRFSASARLAFPCRVDGAKPLALSFRLTPRDLSPVQGEKDIRAVLRFTDRRTVLAVALVRYPGRNEQLFNVVNYLEDGTPVVGEFHYGFEAWRTYEVTIRREEGRLTIGLDGKEMRSVTLTGHSLPSTQLTIGAFADGSALDMSLGNLRLAFSEPPRSHSERLPALVGSWSVTGDALRLEELPGDRLKVTFAGGGDAAMTTRKPVYARAGEHVRVSGRFETVRHEYGSMLRFLINQAAQAPVGLMSGNRYFRPNAQSKPAGTPDRFDFSRSMSPDVPCHFTLSFYGNPQTMILDDVFCRSEEIVRQSRPETSPEPRSYDRAEVDASLAAMSPVRYRLERRGNRVELLLDGQVMPPSIYRRGPHYPPWSRYAAFRDAGIDLCMFFAFFNKPSETHQMNVGNLWLGKGRYDFSKVAEELRVLHGINPRARVIVALGIEPYDGWERDYPEAVFTNAKGEKGYGFTTAKIVYYGEQVETMKKQRENEECFVVPSNYSEEFRREASRAVGALAEFLERDPAGKIVCGLHIIGGADGQFFPYDRDATRGEDHSPAAKRAWSAYLRERYRDDLAALREAWGDPEATFEAPGVPGNAERGNDNLGRQPTRRGQDYVLFISRALTDLRLAMFRAIKEKSGDRLMAGCYYPPGTVGNDDVERLIESPEVDFLIDIQRATMAGSYLLRNKLYIGELDLRVPDIMTPIGNYLFDERLFEYVVRFSQAECVQREGGMYHLFDIGEAYYSDPKYPRFFGQVQQEILSCLDSRLELAPSMGIFCDFRRLAGCSFRSASHLAQITKHAIADLAERGGIGSQCYVLGDVLNPSLKMPKIVWFPFMPDFTADELAALRRRADESGSIIVWGYYRPFQAGTPSRVAGYDFTYLPDGAPAPLRAEAHELTSGLENKVLGESYTGFTYGGTFRMAYERPAQVAVRPGDDVLATYDGSRAAGMVLRKFASGRIEIVNGAPGAFSPRFFRNLARKAGAEVLCENDNVVVFAEAGMLSVACERGGEIAVRLPAGCKVVACATGQSWTAGADGVLRFQAANDGEVAFFKLQRP
ncbi:MAG: hypothetical protein PHC30_06330 [Lentisphaeria bacterium]|nr:hypothetical protein [Lentisphaeria bacterium]